MTFTTGETVGRYRILEQLGQGGMATVYKAYHAELDRHVALKVLHPAFLEDPNFLARFQREARLVAKLEHPNIVPIYDYAEHEKRPYLVMKYIEGETLKARMTRGALGEAEASTTVEAVGAALGYAHKQGILHRDVKPSNVLLATDGQIYLADFGLARIAQSGEATLTTDMILGTPQYISPEQALGKKDLDEGTDIYSFGVMLYEMVVGKVPFSADTPFSIIHDHIYSPLPLPRVVNPEVSEEMELVLLKALSKERQDRYKDVRSMTTAFLQALKAGKPGPKKERALSDTMPRVQSSGGNATTILENPVVEVGVAPAAVVPPVVEASAEVAPAARKERKFGWMWLALAVILVLGCLVVLWGLRSTRNLRAIPTQGGLMQTLAPLQTPQNLLDFGQAVQKVEENPNDPNAHLQLAMACQQSGMDQQEQDAITEVLSLAVGNENFLWDAGRILAGRGAWLSAARLAVEAALVHMEVGPTLPDDRMIFLEEAVYKAMKEEMAGEYLFSDTLMRVDPMLARLAKARFTFFFGSAVQGQGTLDEMMREKPRYAAGQLCQADFSAGVGDVERAKSALEAVRANQAVRGWMLQEADLIEGSLP